MLRKISGLLLIIIAGLLIMAGLNSLYHIITVPIKRTGDAAYDSGQIIGRWLFMAILTLIIFFLLRFGLRLLKNKTKIESIDDIGNEHS